ncbi:MAG: hypothetical protein ACR2GE_00980 [Pseudonocardia sp.]
MTTAAAVTTAATAATVVVGGAVMVVSQDPAPSVESTSSAMRLVESSDANMGAPATVVPVSDGLEQVDAASLVKAAGLAQKQAQEQAQQQVKAAELACPPNAAGFGSVKPWVASAGYYLRCKFDVKSIGGVAGRSGVSDHPLGLALDFMVDRGTGDALADCALRNKAALGITYVIWRQRINYGNGWQFMSDQGGATANHYDHVHISFAPRAGGGSPQCGVGSA